MGTFDFDRIDVWGAELSAHVGPIVRPDAAAIIKCRAPEYVEDARDILYSRACYSKRRLINTVRDWIASQTVAAYHGSRLTEEDIAEIRHSGLLVLSDGSRRTHLRRKLSRHPAWRTADCNLEAVLQKLGPGHYAGKREGQVHATLSRAGLLLGFNHYLTHGSEFDQHAAYLLLGASGKELLAEYGQPTLITLAVPGQQALIAANRSNTEGEPNIVREIITAWAYWLAHPSFSSARLKCDCGMIFWESLSTDWIVAIEAVDPTRE